MFIIIIIIIVIIIINFMCESIPAASIPPRANPRAYRIPRTFEKNVHMSGSAGNIC